MDIQTKIILTNLFYILAVAYFDRVFNFIPKGGAFSSISGYWYIATSISVLYGVTRFIWMM